MRPLTPFILVNTLTWLFLTSSNLVLMVTAYSTLAASASQSVPELVQPTFEKVPTNIEDLPPVNTSLLADDMRFSKGQIQAMNASLLSGVNLARYRWKAQIAFQISTAFSQSDYNIIKSAIQELAGILSNCLRVILWPQNSNPSGDYVFIKNDQPACESFIGRQGGRQTLNLQTPDCISKGTALHEMIHSVGFGHEQVRPDRNKYVRIHWGNIVSGKEYNFERNRTLTNTYGVPYDYHSIMHYRETDFSVNGQKTIEAKAPGIVVGSRGVATPKDRKKIRAMYRC